MKRKRRRNNTATSLPNPEGYELMWTVFTDYRVAYADDKSPWIYPAGERRPAYEPAHVVGLAQALAEVHRAPRDRSDAPATWENYPAVRALLRFVRTYGHLGRTDLETPPWREIKEAGREQWVSGDPVVWALAHASNVHEILTLAGALAHKRSTKALQAYLEARQRSLATFPRAESVPTLAPPWSVPLDAASTDLRAALAKPNSEGRRAALERIGQRLLVQRLDPNLARVDRVYDPGRGVSLFRFRALIQVIYWQLADRFGKVPIRQCACGLWFFSADPRQKYCPPPPEVSESRCSAKYRMRRLRRKARR
jgi:hypothetical protein